ncbi:SMP-30/gluconolactonase/LRE family protein [Georgenia sp. MJ170]|uniref:SMP-30/gluconolactonase/LRE family protein n=1 Tax=Georgenia sunbinii TaxID=3117728 RepID=UPI002F26DAA1
MTGTDLRVATEDAYVLAEGPFWDAPRDRLMWVDIERGLVVVGTLGADGRIAVVEQVSFPGRVGAVAPSAAGDWIVAVDTRLVVRRRSGEVTDGPVLLPAGAGRRLNDGLPDPVGRYLVGTLRMDGPSTEEVLVVVDDDVRVLDDDLMLSNGLAWSADGATLYSIDTEAQIIYRRPWDAAAGTGGERTAHLRVTDGFPDGMTIDAEDHLWVAIWGGGQVRRYAPDGSLVATVEVPVPFVSSVAFAGPRLSTLVITTSHRDLDAAGRRRHPDAGRLFTLEPGVFGAPQPLWSGRLPGPGGGGR